jgi:RNA polymerase sigma-70 factor, ECF subfamily
VIQKEALPAERAEKFASPTLVPAAFAAENNLSHRVAKHDHSICDQVLATVPQLRAFATSLCGSIDRADDLVQETLLRALTRIDSFKPGTNLHAWLFTILRNEFRSEYRKRRREVEDPEERYVESLRTPPEQLARIEFKELLAALGKLPPDQREVLVLVGAAGFSYDEAAAICGCPIGTIKSRMNRGRIRLAEMLSVESVYDFGPDGVTRAILIGGVHC